MQICELCKQQIKFGKGKITLEDYSKGKFIVCSECYTKMPKENKKQLTYIDGKLDVGGFLPVALVGFALGGIVGAITASAGAKSSENWVVNHSQKKYNYTNKQMNDFSIDIFDMHVGMLDDYQHRAVMDKFEGKTNSRYYKKYIQDKLN